MADLGTKEKRVLVVDDERVITDTLITIFSNSSYIARGASSAEQALKTIEGWRPDLVILDVVLPSMNGIDFSTRIRGLYPNCHVSLFSGQAVTADLLESR